MMSLSTPVAFLIFNRPELTEKVFQAIRQAQPSQLLVVADGPRRDRPEEAKRCAMSREIIAQVDWDCKVLKNYSDTNLGCRQRVATGLDWVFQQVESAIILEDDCLPDPTFFQFCQELLEKYDDDQRIMMISGDNFQFGQQRSPYSYYFSRHTHIWGWATWRRAWQHYDLTMQQWSLIRDGNWLNDLLHQPQAVSYWKNIFQQAYEGKIDTWDYAWTFACWLQNGLTILPNVNLISNIGFHAEATHTKDTGSPFANLAVQAMQSPLHHPPFMITDSEADQRTQNTMFRQPTHFDRLKNKLKGTFSKFSEFKY